MRVDRVQIEEGFLNGLDISFTSGLNVIIGERGTGKTSLIELIRFCLGVEGYTSDSIKRSLDHARSILGSGRVTVTLSHGEQKILVTRTSSNESPCASSQYALPIIFSQTEIETVGRLAQGRMKLLDDFCGDQKNTEAYESEMTSEVRSITVEMESLRHEIDKLASKVNEIPTLDIRITELTPQEEKLENL